LGGNVVTQEDYLAALKRVADEVRSYPEWMRQYVFDTYGYLPAGGIAGDFSKE
jgi:hypothetical protein